MDMMYDVIVVGARCAGSPTAMLLARKGYRVLVVDRATFPSDTVSTHVVQPLGVAALARWGVLDRLAATGCPPIHTYAFDFGPFTISGSPGTAENPSPTAPGVPCSINCSSTPPLRPARRFERASPSRRS
jgi:2-polyprenyl-6-methoxyphenol hydroxylase-like FAD-dependent oxidoreductase